MKGPPPQWNRRDCRFDHLVGAAVAQGYGKTLRYTGIETLDRADEVRRGIYRCAKHRGISGDAGPARILIADPAAMGIRKSGDTFELWFRVWAKREGRKRHIRRYGPDRGSWPYNPRRPATAGERESWANRDETGKAVIHG
jgi:hypothetical protein